MRTNLCSQTNTLALTTGKADRTTVQRQIIQTNIQQELQTCTNLFQNLYWYFLLLIGKELIYLHQPVIQLVDVHVCQFINILIVDAEMQSFLIQASPFTFRTNRCFGKLFRPFLRCRRSIFLLQHLNILHHSFIGNKVIGWSADQRTLDFNPFVRAIQHFINRIVRQLLNRCFQRYIVLLKQSTDLPENHRILIFSQRCYRSFINGKFTIGNHFVHINLIDYSQSLTLRTCSLRWIEWEVMRSRFTIRQSGDGTHEPLTIMTDTFRLGIQNHHQPISLAHSGCHTLFQAPVIFLRYH